MNIIPRAKSSSQRMSEAFGAAGESLSENLSQHMLQKQEDKAISDRLGIDLSKIRDPNSRAQILANELAYGKKMKMAGANEGRRYNPSEEIPVDNVPQKKVLPEFLGESTQRKLQKEKSRLPGLGEKQTESNFPDRTVQGKPVQIKSPDEVITFGLEQAQIDRNNGRPTTDEEGIQRAQQQNLHNISYNDHLAKEKEIKVQKQREYGELGRGYASRYFPAEKSSENGYPGAPEELSNLVAKEAERIAQEGGSEADIQAGIQNYTKGLTNLISTAEKSIPSQTLFTDIYNRMMGKGRDHDKAIKDNQIAISPLIDIGLNDFARYVLSRKGQSKELIEDTISSLGEGSKKMLKQFGEFSPSTFSEKTKSKLNEFPKSTKWMDQAGRSGKTSKAHELDPKNIEKLQKNIVDVFQSEPSVNPVLLRKAYMQKNVPWDIFKNVLNDALYNGDIQLTDDQWNMMPYLETPPEDHLDALLKTFNLKK